MATYCGALNAPPHRMISFVRTREMTESKSIAAITQVDANFVGVQRAEQCGCYAMCRSTVAKSAASWKFVLAMLGCDRDDFPIDMFVVDLNGVSARADSQLLLKA